MFKKVFWLFLGVISSLSVLTFATSPSHLYFKNATIETKDIQRIPKMLFTVVQSSKRVSYYIVQFDDSRVKSSEFKESLKNIADVKRYVPDNAFIVRLKGTELDLAAIKHIQWYSPYNSYLKVEKNLLNAKEKEVILDIHLFSNEEQPKIKKELLRLPLAVNDVSSHFFQVRTEPQFISRIASIEGIEWIEKAKEVKIGNFIRRPSSSILEATMDDAKNPYRHFNGYATGAKVLQPDKLYALGIRGKTEKVAIADTGLDTGRLDGLPKDLEGRVEKGYSMGRMENGKWDDPSGHGTHVAGLVAGDGTQSQGQVRGVAYEARLIMQSLFRWISREGKVEKGLVIPGNVGVLLDQAYQEGVRVHTNSWQYAQPSGEYSLQSTFLDEFVWTYPDLVVIFAAGNSGVDLNQDGIIDEASLSVPATAKNCISVGASENLILKGGIQAPWKMLGQFEPDKSIWGAEPLGSDFPSNNLRGMAAFSSRGPTSDGRMKPDLVAPGTNNISLRSKVDEVSEDENWGIFNEDYVFMGGTSMAAPLVAGAAALVREYYKNIEKRLFISSALVKATLINGATDLYPGQFEAIKEIPTSRPNVHEGFGRVNLENSLVPSLPRVRRSIDDTTGIGEGEERIFKVKVINPEEPLRVTLVYNDYPGSPAVQKALVNDLDLSINAQDLVYFPNGLLKADRVNNVENIDIDHPEKGTYVVRVRGEAVPLGLEDSGKQPFSLVISGGIEL